VDKKLDKFHFNVGKQLADIKADVHFESFTLKPSEACKSRNENVFQQLLECLHFSFSSDLTKKSTEGEVRTDCPWTNHSHNWAAATRDVNCRTADAKSTEPTDAADNATNIEKSCYQPLVDYLRNVAKLNAVLVAHGNGLPGGLLFDKFVYTLKRDITVASSELRKAFREPKMKFRVKGRTDVVVIPLDADFPCRQTVDIAIEIKPVGFNVSEGLREAFLQLIGLNVANEIRSPCVILTDLALAHYMMYLECINMMTNKFDLVVKQYKDFNQALWMATSLAGRECTTCHFGAAPTPQGSSNTADEDSLTDIFGSVSLEVAH
jgi:hypothetical protein